MAEVKPNGIVTNGRYNGLFVYLSEDGKGLQLKNEKDYRAGILGGVEARTLFTINNSNVIAYEYKGSVTKSADVNSVVSATFWLGIGAGILASSMGRGQIHNVLVQYTTGETSALQIDDDAYLRLQSILYNKLSHIDFNYNPNKVTENRVIPQKIQENVEQEKVQSRMTVSQGSNVSVDLDNLKALFTRIELFLEDEEWQQAFDYCSSGLDKVPTEYILYIYKMMAENHIKEVGSIYKVPHLAQNKDFAKAIRFAPQEEKEKLEAILQKARAEDDKFLEIKRNFQKYNIKIIDADLYNSAYVTPQGKVIIRGGCAFASQVSKWSDIISISNAGLFMVGLRRDGTVVAAGANESGQCEVSSWNGIIAIATGSSHTVGLRSDGTVVAVGKYQDMQCNVSKWENVVRIFAYGNATYGIDKDGKMLYTGAVSLTREELDLVEDKKIVSLCPTGKILYIVYEDGSVTALKRSVEQSIAELKSYKTSELKDVVDVFGFTLHIVALLNNGKCISVGKNEYGQCNVSHWDDIVSASAGYAHTVGLKKDGTVVATGSNEAKGSESGRIDTDDIKLFDDIFTFTDEYKKIIDDIKSHPLNPVEISDWQTKYEERFAKLGLEAVEALEIDNDEKFLNLVDNAVSELNDIENQSSSKLLKDAVDFIRTHNAEIHRQEIVEMVLKAAKLNNTKKEQAADIINNQGMYGITLITACAMAHNADAVEYLAKMGADVNIKRDDGRTAFWYAAAIPGSPETNSSDIRMAKVLLDHGARVDVQAPNGCAAYNNKTLPEIKSMILKKYPNATMGKGFGGCYVATCVYGSYDCPEVWTLRRYRDDTLGATWYGRLFIRTYYAISPTLVKWFGKTKWFKKMWQGKLDRMVKRLNDSGVENTPYNDKIW